MKIIFLIGGAKSILDFWRGKTKKGKRVLAPSQTKLNGLSVLDGTIIERNGQERIFRFLFVVLEKKKMKKIPDILEKLEISPKESVVIVTDGEKNFVGDMGIEKTPEKRYNLVGPWLLVFFKKDIQLRDVNELASVLFLNREDEMSRRDGKLRP